MDQSQTRPAAAAVQDAFWRDQQRRLLSVLNALIPAGAQVAYVDYPVHSNIGDLMIFHGTEAWLRRAEMRVLTRASMHSFRYPEMESQVIILCHGGGNFGDLYAHQTFREKVVDAYPKNKIVLLPQTLHFQNAHSLARSADKLSSHGNVHLLLRDRNSLEVARKHFTGCRSHLTPDMAAMLYPMRTATAFRKSIGRLCLWRTDVESAHSDSSGTNHCDWAGDWRRLLGPYYPFSRLLQWIHMLLGRFLPSHVSASVWKEFSGQLIHHCACRFARARRVETSRLHGHILATLLGVPNRLHDNCYGKNFAYYRCWLSGFPLTELAQPDEAREGAAPPD
jgi:pyruvyl transferase EpsO